MLLSSSAFSGFLNELSANGMPAPPTTASNQQTQVKSQNRPTHKDVNPHQASRQMQNQQPQINIAMIPETDFSVLEQSTNTWNSIPSNNFQVFSVSSVPEIPLLDLASLSDKKSSFSMNLETAKDAPQIAEVPAWVKNIPEPVIASSVNVETDAFALYNDTPTSTATPPYSLHSFLASAKPSTTKFVLNISATVDESSSLTQLKRRCAALDEMSEHLAAYLPDA